jgi:hypothetical protein
MLFEDKNLLIAVRKPARSHYQVSSTFDGAPDMGTYCHPAPRRTPPIRTGLGGLGLLGRCRKRKGDLSMLGAA